MKKKVCYYLGEMVTKLLGHDLMKLTKVPDGGGNVESQNQKYLF